MEARQFTCTAAFMDGSAIIWVTSCRRSVWARWNGCQTFAILFGTITHANTYSNMHSSNVVAFCLSRL